MVGFPLLLQRVCTGLVPGPSRRRFGLSGVVQLLWAELGAGPVPQVLSRTLRLGSGWHRLFALPRTVPEAKAAGAVAQTLTPHQQGRGVDAGVAGRWLLACRRVLDGPAQAFWPQKKGPGEPDPSLMD
jgi:hypothetical protein